ncbi:PREDICTED: collagen alpha-2(I) chain-like [Lipotes vexillifer]|uniref:Collagen alpha-2(I) chain-like n=1 Tax=Lipotes vexillifer TaxID=118797 RepID=A0A340WWV0_LIPVE|nr:PREDICTED: collagen alpha-2(I) chain-like [Lipotes vexillifer]
METFWCFVEQAEQIVDVGPRPSFLQEDSVLQHQLLRQKLGVLPQRSPRPRGRLGKAAPAAGTGSGPALPGFRRLGRVLAPPEAPAGPLGSGGGAKVGCTAPRPHPPRDCGGSRPPPQRCPPVTARLQLSGAGAGAAQVRAPPRASGTWNPGYRALTQTRCPRPSCGRPGQPCGGSSFNSRGHRSAPIGAHASGDVAVARRPSPARAGRTNGAGGHGQVIRHHRAGRGGDCDSAAGRGGIAKLGAQPHPGAAHRDSQGKWGLVQLRPEGQVEGWGDAGVQYRDSASSGPAGRGGRGDGADGGSEWKRRGLRRHKEEQPQKWGRWGARKGCRKPQQGRELERRRQEACQVLATGLVG